MAKTIKKVTVAKANSYTTNYVVKIGGKELPGIYGSKSEMEHVAAANRKVLKKLSAKKKK